jgi:hypothetical protein
MTLPKSFAYWMDVETSMKFWMATDSRERDRAQTAATGATAVLSHTALGPRKDAEVGAYDIAREARPNYATRPQHDDAIIGPATFGCTF